MFEYIDDGGGHSRTFVYNCIYVCAWMCVHMFMYRRPGQWSVEIRSRVAVSYTMLLVKGDRAFVSASWLLLECVSACVYATYEGLRGKVVKPKKVEFTPTHLGIGLKCVSEATDHLRFSKFWQYAGIECNISSSFLCISENFQYLILGCTTLPLDPSYIQ